MARHYAVNGGKVRKNPMIKPGDFITIFTDASYCHTTGAWGFGFWAKWDAPVQTHLGEGGGTGLDGSLRAEMEALLEAMAWVRKLPLEQRQGKILVMQTDCMGAMPRLEAALYALLRECGLKKAYFKHVKGHTGNADPRAYVNNLCDKAARKQMKMHRSKLAYSGPQTTTEATT